mmetsp:Transcript_160143/g.513818  ORF Transcript_160143/g.513818 Transcript_160143/m.513818 type:complete len:180 (+) Transcript_160143:54-593(+)|eukprot:CAMPEP_0203846942 /NCGR_PEP_ID=MMETSP0359-20131031/4732_1 /ASSEMBLY_ACC=CAM_ASM_000338 /TAXON_ID=268821 /ORGANISM="Scrippsiella Hangoei, Strain SHTV-5" /LENGTH=179 /DNA_ID=CAMNT_0050762343 /DNA_START=54 /DNA_END=593 /DNA_ORIENTATION=-
MAFQRSYGRLQSSPHWRTLEEFAADSTKLELAFGLRVTSTAREDIRQICKYLGLNFRCLGQGLQKKIVALKSDALRERKRAEEVTAAAPKHVGGFYRGALALLGPGHAVKVNALFVQEYVGEKAWSLGEGPAPGEPAAKRPRQGDAGGGDSDSEDVEALLGRYVTITKESIDDIEADDI